MGTSSSAEVHERSWVLAPVTQPADGVATLIVDLDGVYAIPVAGRSIYDTVRVDEDGCDLMTHAFVTGWKSLNPSGQVVIVTGRLEKARDATLRWAERHGVSFDLLLMRSRGDNRPAPAVKFDLWEEHLSQTARVVAALDDDARIVTMWRECGFPAWQPHQPLACGAE
jgi:hypothetical protein